MSTFFSFFRPRGAGGFNTAHVFACFGRSDRKVKNDASKERSSSRKAAQMNAFAYRLYIIKITFITAV